ncbi:MAG: ABC transporter ATP-binding protein [Rhodospirillales bacterium]|nr:ABC transporter ATP-binding protein [Rhodospirillaceae bacterium]MDP6427980.1 ABC transporter ATP-binding protein [Rhodospirillales bacterium]MDP6646016.1 ABC transporter ATP-binding protein [Rhodospirillales bacterium]MDP6841201.1 ABC transporter ATP-binding protein [Rhodospirillales bacterium]
MSKGLAIEGLCGGYGGANILNGLNLGVEAGELVVVVGPNGAGKSTMMKAIFGLAEISAGRVLYGETDITGLRADRIARFGIAYVPQEANVFPSLTVTENLEMGGFLLDRSAQPEIERIFALFPRLAERRYQAAGLMSGGERQMLAMGRALMMAPGLLLLDEPTAALAPNLVDETLRRIAEINELGIAILMIEQNAKQALAVADRGVVLVMGENRFEDTGANILGNEDVAKMYLGA